MGVVDDRIQVPCAFFRAPELGLREADSAVDAVAVGGAGGPGPGRAEPAASASAGRAHTAISPSPSTTYSIRR